MLKQIKQFFKKYQDMSYAVDYLSNHICYHLMGTYKLSSNDDNFAIFGQEQLKFLITSKISSLSDKQVNMVINLALKKVISNTKARSITTRNIIYIAL
ncbi:MAG: hypothetical protein ACK5Z5_08710 [Neisseriaceae bacterium]